MKKGLAMMFAAILEACLFFACTSTPPPPSSAATSSEPLLADTAPPQAGAQMVMVISEEDVDSSFVQSAWSTLNRFSGEEGLSSGLYQADTASPSAVLDTVELAERGGAELVVMAGAAMAEAAANAQVLYPDISFILLGMPEGTPLQENAVSVKFVPEQGGWLAGYAAVAEGRTQLAYYDIPGDEAAQKYALGFLLGAEAAAANAGLEEGAVTVYPLAQPLGGDGAEAQGELGAGGEGDGEDDAARTSAESEGRVGERVAVGNGAAEQSAAGETAFREAEANGSAGGSPSAASDGASAAEREDASTGGDAPSDAQRNEPDAEPLPDWRELARLAFGAGADTLFVNSGALASDALAAARAAKLEQPPLIGIVPSLQTDEPQVLTAVVKDPKNVLNALFSSWRGGRFPGGTEAIATVSGAGVALDYEGSAFTRFTKLDYDAAIDRFRLTGLASSIAVKLAPGEDGSLPEAQTLPLPHLRFADVFAPQAPPEEPVADENAGAEPEGPSAQSEPAQSSEATSAPEGTAKSAADSG